jgi:hypothetical protein
MAKLTANPKEIDIQAGFRARLRYVAPAVSCVAIPNAAKRSQWAAMQAKREGMSAGFPDVMCLWAGGGVCFIEFKAAKGRINDNQNDWLARLDRWGFVVGVARSIDDAIAILRTAGAPVMECAA